MEQWEIDEHGALNRPAEPAQVRTRQVELTADQQLLIRVTLTRLQQICPNAETAVAVLVSVLSDFLLHTAKPELLPEAVATAVACLQYNCGIAEPVNDPRMVNDFVIRDAALRDGILTHAENCQCNGCVGSRD